MTNSYDKSTKYAETLVHELRQLVRLISYIQSRLDSPEFKDPLANLDIGYEHGTSAAGVPFDIHDVLKARVDELTTINRNCRWIEGLGHYVLDEYKTVQSTQSHSMGQEVRKACEEIVAVCKTAQSQLDKMMKLFRRAEFDRSYTLLESLSMPLKAK